MYLKRGSRAEFVSTAINDDFLGVGSSPFQGDIGATGVAVPAAPSAPDQRYLIRVCGFDIPGGYRARILGLRQLVILRATVTIETEDPPEVDHQLPIEIEQESPLWAFPDGNVSWHLLQFSNRLARTGIDAAQANGTSPDLNVLSSALVYTVGGLGESIIPPGTPVANLATWRDLRYPWTTNRWGLDARVEGPGNVVLFASVKQTDPETRPVRRSPLDLSAIRKEDRFLLEYPLSARYGRVAGAMLVEFDGGPT